MITNSDGDDGEIGLSRRRIKTFRELPGCEFRQQITNTDCSSNKHKLQEIEINGDFAKM